MARPAKPMFALAGPREEREHGPDPVVLAALLGIPYRVCELSAMMTAPCRT